MTKKKGQSQGCQNIYRNFPKLGQCPEFEILLESVLTYSYDLGAFFGLYLV